MNIPCVSLESTFGEIQNCIGMRMADTITSRTKIVPFHPGLLLTCIIISSTALGSSAKNIVGDEILTLSPTSPGFYVSALQVLGKHCGKRRNCS